MNAYHLQIVTPDGLRFDGEAQSLLVRTTTGDVGIRARHANYVAPLGMGVARVTIDGQERRGACVGGMVSVLKGEVRLLATSFEWAEDIDVERAKAAEERGKAFLAENAKKDGVKTTESGLQYKIEKQGEGEIPADTSVVSVHYRGTLIDGTEFDSSYKRNKPTEFPVNRVIAGWTEALKMMPVGSKWTLYIPSNLAYGPRGAGQLIGPNETLIFEVELLGIVPPQDKKAEK